MRIISSITKGMAMLPRRIPILSVGDPVIVIKLQCSNHSWTVGVFTNEGISEVEREGPPPDWMWTLPLSR